MTFFVLSTTKQLLKETQFSTLLQVDETYKLTWNELPLLVFGSSDANCHFQPLGVALVSNDEKSTCYIDLFRQLKNISTQENQCEYSVNYLMADGATGKAFVLNYFCFECYMFWNYKCSKESFSSNKASYVLDACCSQMSGTYSSGQKFPPTCNYLETLENSISLVYRSFHLF